MRHPLLAVKFLLGLTVTVGAWAIAPAARALPQISTSAPSVQPSAHSAGIEAVAYYNHYYHHYYHRYYHRHYYHHYYHPYYHHYYHHYYHR